VRWGPKDPEYGISFHSLGSKLFDLAQWAGGGFGAHRRERDVASIPVSYDWVREHYPAAGWPWDGSELEEGEDDQEVDAAAGAALPDRGVSGLTD
jgi:hypothetical protein